MTQEVPMETKARRLNIEGYVSPCPRCGQTTLVSLFINRRANRQYVGCMKDGCSYTSALFIHKKRKYFTG